MPDPVTSAAADPRIGPQFPTSIQERSTATGGGGGLSRDSGRASLLVSGLAHRDLRSEPGRHPARQGPRTPITAERRLEFSPSGPFRGRRDTPKSMATKSGVVMSSSTSLRLRKWILQIH